MTLCANSQNAFHKSQPIHHLQRMQCLAALYELVQRGSRQSFTGAEIAQVMPKSDAHIPGRRMCDLYRMDLVDRPDSRKEGPKCPVTGNPSFDYWLTSKGRLIAQKLCEGAA